MKPKPNPELVDGDNPEWSEADFRRAVPFSQLPADLRRTLASERISVRLSPEIVAAFIETGPDWEARIDEALREWLARHSPDEPAQESSN